MKKILFTLCLLCTMTWGFAQIDTPAASPFCKIEQKVGLTDITIEYSRPSVKDRTIFADDGLVPYGKMWRTGANAVTKITLSETAKLGGQKVAPGTYAVLSIPRANGEWTFNLYEYAERGWTTYQAKSPAVVFSAKAKEIPMSVESLLIVMDNLRDESASIELMWERTHVSIPVEVESDEKVMENIQKAIAGTTSGEYYTAASYYYKTGRDLQQALTWIQLANATDKPKFWQVRKEAQILAKLGRYKDAVKTAEKSMELARSAGNNEYVRFNQADIKEWSAMK